MYLLCHSNELTCHIVSNLNWAHLYGTCTQMNSKCTCHTCCLPRVGIWDVEHGLMVAAGMCVCVCVCVCLCVWQAALAAAVCARSTKWINFFRAYSLAVNSVKVHTFDLFFFLFLFFLPFLLYTLSSFCLSPLPYHHTPQAHLPITTLHLVVDCFLASTNFLTTFVFLSQNSFSIMPYSRGGWAGYGFVWGLGGRRGIYKVTETTKV